MTQKNNNGLLPSVIVRNRSRMRVWCFSLVILSFIINTLGFCVDAIPYAGARHISFYLMILAAIVGIRFMWVEHRLEVVVVQADYALCLHCKYSLTGLGPTGKCPECGTAYNLEDVRARWLYWRPLWPWLQTDEK